MTLAWAALIALQDWSEIGRSVVALRSGGAVGSGFIVDEKGYVLTNAHVAACPLPFEAELVDSQGRVVRYKKTLLVGVHPERDLALLKIDPAEHRLTLRPLRFSGRPPSIEQKVYAVGYPHGGDRQVRTDGKVLATDRVAFRRHYIEMDAVIHPGNSGGPLLAEDGRVVGVVTLKDTRADTGLAIPAWEFQPRIFVPLRQRPPDPAAAAELLSGAERCLRAAREEGDPFAAAVAVHLFERAVSWDPGNAALLVKIGLFHAIRGRSDSAAAYLFRSLQIQPWPDEGPDVYLGLSGLLAKLGHKDDALCVGLEGFAKYPDRSVALFEILAMVSRDAREWLDAARWSSMALRQGSRRPEEMNRVLQESRRSMTPQETGVFFEEDAQYESRIAGLKRESEAAQRDGRAALTKKFKTFLDTFQGVQREGGDSLNVGRPASVAPDAEAYTEDEVTRLFLEAQLRVAREHLRAGRLDAGRKMLEELVGSTHPKSPSVQEARALLDLMKK